MRKFATYSVLVLVAYIAGNVRHFGLDKSLAFIAPAVPYVTAAGDALWSVVRPDGEWLVARLGPGSSPTMTGGLVPAMTGGLVGVWLLLSVACAMAAACQNCQNPAFKDKRGLGLCLVKRGIWDNRPTMDGRRTLPLWLAALIPFVAVIEFGSRLCYFVGFTVVTLFAVPLKALVGLVTCDLSRPLRCLAAFVVVAAATDLSGAVASASGIRVGMKVETQNATNTGLYPPAEIIHIFQTPAGRLAELKLAGTGRCFRYADEFRVL